MATSCPQCHEVVRPVVTMVPGCCGDTFDNCIDSDRGLHCPACQYRFADAEDVYLDATHR